MTVQPTVQPHTIIIGGGPVGAAAALILAAAGHRVTLCEAHAAPDYSDDNSYPIGVNIRGQRTLNAIDPTLLDQLRAHGETVRAFNIYSGTRRIAHVPSGTLIATTRAYLTSILIDRVHAEPNITYRPGHRLIGINPADRTLTFRTPTADAELIDASDARVIAADGVWSTVRTQLARAYPDFAPRIGDWGVKFRVVYSQPNASAPALDPADHHIFTSGGIYTATLKNRVWGLAISAAEHDPTSFLLADTATPSAIARLRAHIEQCAPLAVPLLTDADYSAFFDRAPLGGAVVLCPRLAFDEWALLIGDAAHSVIPPTGEGVNSGLEDCLLLGDHARTASPTWFADYETARLPDLRALGSYAWELRNNVRSTDPARTAANVGVRIVDTLAAAAHLPNAQVEARLFGPHSTGEPYRDAIGPWLRQRRAVFPVAYGIVDAVRSAVGEVRLAAVKVRSAVVKVRSTAVRERSTPAASTVLTRVRRALRRGASALKNRGERHDPTGKQSQSE